jgi:hypothetical protein
MSSKNPSRPAKSAVKSAKDNSYAKASLIASKKPKPPFMPILRQGRAVRLKEGR